MKFFISLFLCLAFNQYVMAEPKDFFVIRNFDAVQFEDLRRRIDPKFNQAHDELSDCYYNYWKEGKSKPFHGYDVQATLGESKELFDKLHGLIFLYRDVLFHQENFRQPEVDRIPEEKYNNILDDQGQVIGKKSDKAAEKIQKLQSQEGISIILP